MRHALAAAALAAIIASGAASASVPGTISFTARLVDEASGGLVKGTHHVDFELFDAETGGASVWKESRDVNVEEGLLFTGLGEVKALDAMVFSGRRLYLQVTLDNAVMDPRVAIDSVPYAVRAAAADDAAAVGGIAAKDVQRRVTGTCGVGSFIAAVNADGTVLCAPDQSGTGDITSVTTGAASGLVGGVTSGDAALSLLTTCAAGQLLKWNGVAWGCANDIDTDTNSGGDITDVIAGNGLINGGSTGAVSLDVVGTNGIAVSANAVSLDLTFTDPRYVNTSGDTMAGTLDMNNQRLPNRGCPAGYVRVGPGLCTEDVDGSGFTFGACANRCRAAGTHMCSSAEMRAVVASGVALSVSVVLDWLDDQNGDDSALFVNSVSSENIDGTRATSTSSFCRCCANVE